MTKTLEEYKRMLFLQSNQIQRRMEMFNFKFYFLKLMAESISSDFETLSIISNPEIKQLEEEMNKNENKNENLKENLNENSKEKEKNLKRRIQFEVEKEIKNEEIIDNIPQNPTQKQKNSFIHFACGHKYLLGDLTTNQLLQRKCPLWVKAKIESQQKNKKFKCPRIYYKPIKESLKEAENKQNNKKAVLLRYYSSQKELIENYNRDSKIRSSEDENLNQKLNENLNQKLNENLNENLSETQTEKVDHNENQLDNENQLENQNQKENLTQIQIENKNLIDNLFDPKNENVQQNLSSNPQTDWEDFENLDEVKEEVKPQNIMKIPSVSFSEDEQNKSSKSSGFDLSEEEKDKKKKAIPDQAEKSKLMKRKIRVSFACNVFLVCAKWISVFFSQSLTVLASAIDSVLDILSGFIVYLTERFINRKKVNDRYRYPVGKWRMEPIGILIFSAVMSTVAFQIIFRSIQNLIFKNKDVKLGTFALVVLCMTVGIKLFLFIWCRKDRSDIVRALANDHRNDVASNSFGIVMAMIGDKLIWWFDSIGAMAIALLILVTWAFKIYENIFLLVGVAASPEFLNRILFLSLKHHDSIIAVERVKAFRLGQQYFVEVDIVLPADMLLDEAHDIGESLQNKLEKFEEIERAFVHVDVDLDHNPEHERKDF
ncbi:cdf divalent metal cation transporter (eurofung) [Anaeramoeba ignava]|uniref:Cdf divalent metal cation transporter (Eurofung) n=1 Tax=Anaeramoeba ignava TaxID=1746090 RepID=A0A9Q0LJ95_ANAIG|nr:cdf divalent metal cation transporter (eurofung) [Anaeramoeba ignava]